jgi:hypothetical protein
MAHSLSKLVSPRQSVFGRGQSDTVAEIADLPKLDARTFFGETHITEGMAVLLRQVFDRLMGRSDQGVFRLKQAMGGGKTHSLLAAALLANDATERKAIPGRSFEKNPVYASRAAFRRAKSEALDTGRPETTMVMYIGGYDDGLRPTIKRKSLSRSRVAA